MYQIIAKGTPKQQQTTGEKRSHGSLIQDGGDEAESAPKRQALDFVLSNPAFIEDPFHQVSDSSHQTTPDRSGDQSSGYHQVFTPSDRFERASWSTGPCPTIVVESSPDRTPSYKLQQSYSPNPTESPGSAFSGIDLETAATSANCSGIFEDSRRLEVQNKSPDHLQSPDNCFGMITGLQISAFANLNYTRYLALCKSRQDLTLRPRMQSGLTVVAGNDEHGALETNIARILSALKTVCPSVFYKAFLASGCTLGRRMERGRQLYPIEILVFGQACDAEHAGDLLAAEELYLQEPEDLDSNIRYNNPHTYSIGADGTTPRFRLGESTEKTFQDEVDDVIFGSYGDCPFQSFDPDSRIFATLHPHQIAAVQFMIARESPTPHRHGLSLWTQAPEYNVNLYQHRVTGTKRDKLPLECRGGILLDEMGMGKTLSALALVVQSLEEARAYGSTSNGPSSCSPNHRPLGATLIITPKSTITSWMAEIERHVDKTEVRAMIYPSQREAENQTLLVNSDIVITSFETASSDIRSTTSGIIAKRSWFRVILDEAHKIRNPSTQMFKALARVRAQRRWCLTGTPIQNSLLDLFSLTKFLRFAPFDENPVVREHIILPLKNKESKGINNLRLMMRTISLRRNKQACNIPVKHEEIVPVALSAEERLRYDMIESEALSEGDTSDLANRAPIQWRATLKRRQLCSHGISAANTGPIVGNIQKSCDGHGCPNDLSRQVSIRGQCGHLFCGDCLAVHNIDMKASTLQTCPLCGDYLTVLGSGNEAIIEPEIDGVVIPENTFLDGAVTPCSSKLEAIVSRLVQIGRTRLDDGQGPQKSLVFSSWKTTLNCLGKMLDQNNISYLRIDGDHELEQRKHAIEEFQSDPGMTVLILTLGAGAVGLNLTAASFVHLVEPHYNPMVEAQAAARVHRIGQRREVYIYQYIVQNSVEEEIKVTQKKKLYLAELSDSKNTGPV